MADAGDDEHHHHGNCEEALHDLYGYLDGELTDDRRSLIKGHLDDCNPCFEAFDFEAELRIVISHRCRDEVPDSLRSRIAEQLAALEELCDHDAMPRTVSKTTSASNPETSPSS